MKSHNRPKALEAWVNLISDKPMKDGTLTPIEPYDDINEQAGDLLELIEDAKQLGRIEEREAVIDLLNREQIGASFDRRALIANIRTKVVERGFTDQASSPDSQGSRPSSQAA